jgi:hypothetical protein
MDAKLIAFDDEDDDDPGRYAEDAMPDDFFSQFKVSTNNTNNTTANNSLISNRQRNEESTKRTDIYDKDIDDDNDDNNTMKMMMTIKDINNELKMANKTIIDCEIALREALDWPLRTQTTTHNQKCSREELLGLIRHLSSDLVEARRINSQSSFINQRQQQQQQTSTSNKVLPSKESVEYFGKQLERVNIEKESAQREKSRVEYENKQYKKALEQSQETKRDVEQALRKTLARLQKYERAFDAADVKNRELRDRIQALSRRLVDSEAKVGDAKIAVDIAEKRTTRAIMEMERAKTVATARTERAQAAELRAKSAIADAQDKKKERDELFQETRKLEAKCLDLAMQSSRSGRNGHDMNNEHSRTIAELSALSQELAREEMMTRKRCEDVEKERDALRLELCSLNAELKAQRDEINRAHERDMNYVISASGGNAAATKSLMYHQQNTSNVTNVEATPGFGFFNSNNVPSSSTIVTGRELKFDDNKDDLSQQRQSQQHQEQQQEEQEQVTTATKMSTADKQKNLALLKEFQETRRLIKEERQLRLEAERKLEV